MLFPWKTDSPLHSTPWMNGLLIFLNVVIFGLQRLNPSWQSHYVLSPQHPVLITYITYLFLHSGIPHLVGNMIFLYIFGNNVNDKMGPWGYLAFYLAGGVMGGVGYVLTQTASNPVLGASGAVAAVTGAYLVLFPRSNITVIYFFIIVGQFEVSSMLFIIVFFAKDLFFSISGDMGVAHAAHVAGTLFGFSICLSLLAARLLPRDQFDVLALAQRWNKRRQYQSLVRQGYDPFAYIPPPPREGVKAEEIDPKTQRILEMRAEISEAVAHHNLPHAAMLFMRLKQLDPTQVLSRQAQLDIANQLASQQFYLQAADAYEAFIRCFPNYEQIEHVQLMLGLIYARYLHQYDRAQTHLNRVIDRLHSGRELQLAQAELERIKPLLPNQTR